jgi:DNA invertase Pin-like site-specific DNA recombinase
MIALQVKEIGSGGSHREKGMKILEAARRPEIDVVLVWRLDRWGRSVTDLLATLQELEHLGVGVGSLTEALDLTTLAGLAMVGLLAVFAELEQEILRERVRAGLGHARQNGLRLWAGHSWQPSALSCTALARAKPKSPASCNLVVPPYAVF